MRSIPTEWLPLAFSSKRAVHFRARVSNGSWGAGVAWGSNGTIWDLSRLRVPGQGYWDWCVSCTVTESLDNAVGTVNLQLFREMEAISLNPEFWRTSVLQKDASGNPIKILDPGRLLLIEVQLAPYGVAPNPSGTWMAIFDGRIDEVDTGNDNKNLITITGRDYGGGILQDLMIEKDYPSTPTTYESRDTWFDTFISGFTQGANGTGAALQKMLQGVIDGVMGQSNPWPNSPISAVSPWPVPPAIYVENDPGYYVEPSFNSGSSSQTVLKSGPLLDFLTSQVQQIGYDLRWRYQSTAESGVTDEANPNNAGAGWSTPTYQMTLWNPPRSFTNGVQPPATAGAYDATGLKAWALSDDLYNVSSSKKSLLNVRNRVACWWYDKGASGQPWLGNIGGASLFTEDSGSEAAYGVRTMIPAPDATGNIVSASEATSTATTILGDLKNPWLTTTTTSIFFPFAALGDCVGLGASARNRMWPAAKYFLLTGFEHSLGQGKASTQPTLREVVVANVESGTVPPGTPPSGTNPGASGALSRPWQTANTAIAGMAKNLRPNTHATMQMNNVEVFLYKQQPVVYSGGPTENIIQWGIGALTTASPPVPSGDVIRNLGDGWIRQAMPLPGWKKGSIPTPCFFSSYSGNYVITWGITYYVPVGAEMLLTVYVMQADGSVQGHGQAFDNRTGGSPLTGQWLGSVSFPSPQTVYLTKGCAVWATATAQVGTVYVSGVNNAVGSAGTSDTTFLKVIG